MNIDRCKKVVSAIDTLSKMEVEELFRMIHKERYDYTKNNHGVFINLTWIPESLLSQIEQYIDFCHRSKSELQKYESICDILNTKMHTPPVEDDSMLPTNTPTMPHSSEDSSEKVTGSRVSTSMRFYLLKKRFSKMSACPNNFESDLKPDPYVISG